MMKKETKNAGSNCETCVFYDYDDIEDCYYCTVNLDQDDLGNFLSGETKNCPYYRFYDEYKSVHKQI